MQSTIIKLNDSYYTQALLLLKEEELWNLIPYDAFLRYGLQHPEHEWFGEVEQGSLVRLLYKTKQLIHLVSPKPFHLSRLSTLIRSSKAPIIMHGKKETVEGFLFGMRNRRLKKMDDALFVQQSVHTSRIIRSVPIDAKNSVHLRPAEEKDYLNILELYKKSDIDHLVDPVLIQQLIQLKKVKIAEKINHYGHNSSFDTRSNPKLLGTLMCLKESKRYVLLGGLLVHPEYRHHGIASKLGRDVILDANSRGKKICFYYNDKSLKRFYEKIELEPLGRWVSYVITSKATT
ncbi:GNAT family N-acetyltransferase [Bacillus horti]|uniref:GNAT superfamily N-acetyltransferase n=1 Tax=Caldalkalibacillus horti TaxID=77523 RepID=A0ABT9W3K7_9BACI|nr:GNAT family N-acetyltransferase [Bacillus horti]MDQ0167828.1 GNAT superfamily N-acetyltransferase [Bacillus horti]